MLVLVLVAMVVAVSVAVAVAAVGSLKGRPAPRAVGKGVRLRGAYRGAMAARRASPR